MRSHLLLISAALGLLAAPLLAQTKGKKTLQKKAVATTSQKSASAAPTATPAPPPSQPMAEPTREGVTTEMGVLDLDGTTMVQHTDQEAPTALQTGSTVERGDQLKVHDGAWVIFKTRRGDRIGFSSGTEVAIEEMYFEGPDRQIRIILGKGSVFLRTNNADSRQSFFEVQAGQQVISIGDCETRIDHDPSTQLVRVQYMHGKVRVIDPERETKFSVDDSEWSWSAGKKTSEEATTLEEESVLNFRRFFEGKPELEKSDPNRLLPNEAGKRRPSQP